MSIKSALGLESAIKIRYGIVALGDISQESLMPGVSHTGNSVITALVTADPAKAKGVAKEYNVPPEDVYAYEQFDDLLHSGKIDAIYLATPNFRHAEFAVPALKAGIHVLLEKPMEITGALCEQIINAQKQSLKTKLMIAYRLHFEPATLAVIDAIRSDKLGELRTFSSVFSQLIDPQNHRATNGNAAGPLLDMGTYPLNAVRNLFEAEPTEVFACGLRHPDAGLPMDFDHTVAVTLKFPGNRIAQFTTSYATEAVDTFVLSGTKGTLTMSPAFGMDTPKTITIETKANGSSAETYRSTDHFGGELKYFSDCILNDAAPEPDGEEGLMDVRVHEAIFASIKSGRPVTLAPVDRARRIDLKQVEKLRMVSPPKPVNAKKPAKK